MPDPSLSQARYDFYTNWWNNSIGKVCLNNSTYTPIGGGETFTGTTGEVLQGSVIVVAIYSDVASATDGFKVQFSVDGTNWDHEDVFTIPADTGKTFSFQPVAQYFRVIYVNGAAPQTEFRCQVVLKTTYVKPSSHRIGDIISPEDDAELSKAALTAQKPNGDFAPIDATAGGNLKVSVEEVIPGFNIPEYDELVITYVAAGNGVGEIETMVYKNNTVTVATLTLSYNGDDKLSGVVIS